MNSQFSSSSRLPSFANNRPPDQRFGILAICIGGGPVFAVFALLIMYDRLDVQQFALGLLLAIVLGFIAGIICLPIVYLTLRNRDLSTWLPVIGWIVASVTLLLSLLPMPDAMWVPLFGVPLCLAISSAAVAVWTPRIYRNPYRCLRCGYNICASMEFGRCPECGHALSRRISGASRKSVSLAARLIAHHPILVILSIIFVTMAYRTATDSRAMSAQQFLQAVRTSLENDVPFELADTADFDWNLAYVFSGYTNNEVINQRLGFKWNSISRPDISLSDTRQLLVFVEGNQVVAYCELPDVTTVHGVSFSGQTPFHPSARFKVRQDVTYPKRMHLELIEEVRAPP